MVCKSWLNAQIRQEMCQTGSSVNPPKAIVYTLYIYFGEAIVYTLYIYFGEVIVYTLYIYFGEVIVYTLYIYFSKVIVYTLYIYFGKVIVYTLYIYIQTVISGSVWKSMSIALELNNVTVEFLQSHQNSAQKNTSLACLDLNKSRLTYESYSDGSKDVDLVSHEITAHDTRFTGKGLTAH